MQGLDRCFLASTMNYVTSDQKKSELEKIAMIVNDCKMKGIAVKMPRINKTHKLTKPDKHTNTIFLAPSIIKGLGNTVNNILTSKNDFKTLEEFLIWSGNQFTYKTKEDGSTSKTRVFNKATYLLLIKAGFFEEFQEDPQVVWEQINNFKIKKFGYREKKYIKTRKKWEYKCKNNAKLKEYIVEDYEKTCKVREEYPLLEKGLDKLTGDTVSWEYELLEFNLNNPLDELYPQYIPKSANDECLMKVIKSKKGTWTSKDGSKKWDYTDIWGLFDDQHLDMPEKIRVSGWNDVSVGQVYWLKYYINKGFHNIKDWKLLSLKEKLVD